MHVNNEILKIISEAEGLKGATFNPLSGGDINVVYKVSASSGCFVLKINDAGKFPNMFEAERKGLETLQQACAIKIPQVFSNNKIGSFAYLLLEFIPPAEKKSGFWEAFGRQLADLHQNTADFFGFEHQNYIGSLPQYNQYSESTSEFYINQRLEPQITMAHKKGFRFGNLENFFKNVAEEIPLEKPALVHGDLWGGNFLVSKNSEPVLIDPAVAYAPREMDIAMMHLFGGFDDTLFGSYHEIFPLHNNWKQRLDLWQLYYLLVHLNIFGAAYLSRVQRIIYNYS